MRTETGVEFAPQGVDLSKATNVMDRWIQAATRELVNTVREEMDFYHHSNSREVHTISQHLRALQPQAAEA
jgi:isoleucyl-tRNA synthetase